MARTYKQRKKVPLNHSPGISKASKKQDLEKQEIFEGGVEAHLNRSPGIRHSLLVVSQDGVHHGRHVHGGDDCGVFALLCEGLDQLQRHLQGERVCSTWFA